MYPFYFTAILKDEEGKILEEGAACISQTEAKVTFQNEFVPLVKLGATVSITRMLGDRELETFTGQVYPSSRNLLQIVGVDEEVRSKVLKMFEVNSQIAANFIISPNNTPNFNMKKAERLVGDIRYLSSDKIKIVSAYSFKKGQYILISTEEPVAISNIGVKIEEVILANPDNPIYVCKIMSISPEDRSVLEECIKMIESTNKEPDFYNEIPVELTYRS